MGSEFLLGATGSVSIDWDKLGSAIRLRLSKSLGGAAVSQVEEDLVQEAFLAAYERISKDPGGFIGEDHLGAWSAKVAWHKWVDRARRSRNAVGAAASLEQCDVDSLAGSTPEDCFDIEALGFALAELEVFDPPMAQAVELRFFGGYSAREAAEILGMPLRTFERRWVQTRGWLRQRIESY